MIADDRLDITTLDDDDDLLDLVGGGNCGANCATICGFAGGSGCAIGCALGGAVGGCAETGLLAAPLAGYFALMVATGAGLSLVTSQAAPNQAPTS